MLDQLVGLVSEKVGISEDQAKMAVDTVLGYVKQQLPPEMATQFDALIGLAGGGAGAGNLDLGQVGNLLSGLGDMLGGDKK